MLSEDDLKLETNAVGIFFKIEKKIKLHKSGSTRVYMKKVDDMVVSDISTKLTFLNERRKSDTER